DQWIPEHDLGDLATLLARADELDPSPVLPAVLKAALAPAAGMNLRLEHHLSADLVKGLLSRLRRGGDDAARDDRPGRRQGFYCLVFVDLHRVFPWRKDNVFVISPQGFKGHNAELCINPVRKKWLTNALVADIVKPDTEEQPKPPMNEVTNLLRDLVSLPSVNPMGRVIPAEIMFEHRVTDYLENFFRRLGVSWQRQHVAPQRENIVARWESPGARRTLLLEAHQDTVPTDHMTIDPFGAKIDNGRLYGRGACDIKGGMAAMLAAFARRVRERPCGAANVVMACTVDEEHTFLGVQRLVQGGFRVDMAVVAEPTDLDIVTAHKGVVRWYLSTAGRSCHSSRPEQGVNAIYRMAGL